jgi:hypothetical protein
MVGDARNEGAWVLAPRGCAADPSGKPDIATQIRSGASARKRRSTRPGAGRAPGARSVVQTHLRRLTPSSPRAPHASSAAQRAYARREFPPRRAGHECAVRHRFRASARESRKCGSATLRPPAPVPRRTLAPRIVAAGGNFQQATHRGHRIVGLICTHEFEPLSEILSVSRAP